MNRRPHNPDAKAQARQLYQAHGTDRAAAATGIPARTLRRWARLEQWPPPAATTQAPDQRLHLVVPGVTGPPEKSSPPGRPRLAMRIRQEVWAHLDQLAAYREGKRVRDAKDCAIVVGILLDKLLVLEQRDQAGGAPDSASAVSRLWELVDAAEGRAAGNG